MMLTISNSTIRMVNGLYSLNDLHRISGGLKRHQPSNFMRRKQTREIITALNIEYSSSSETRSLQPVRVIEGIQTDGIPQGTFVCRELVYSYAMWISSSFQLLVIRAFDTMAKQQNQLSQQFNALCREYSTVDRNLSNAGRFLVVAGKQIKPQLQREIDNKLKQMQCSLDFRGGDNNDE